MFPDRMDKLILDGVVNPHDYYQNTYAIIPLLLLSPTACKPTHDDY
jgi:hypothetical protein